ncbi:MAG: hypothetical protein K5873_02890 [Treponema sp.]|nr:hypothetical protein [Treponema sp.]
MKKFLGKSVGILLALSALFGFFSCSDSADDTDSDSSKSTSPTSYTNLSVGRAYMGGSLVYNESEGANQLKSGTVIAVREGTLSAHTETKAVYEYQDSYGSTQQNISSLTPTSKSVTVYEDEPSKAIYGYITISSVSLEKISFSYTRYNLSGTSSSTNSYTIEKGKEGADINGDGSVNIKYREPNAIRDGFEKSCWLEFVCNSDVLTDSKLDSTSSTMFSVITASELNGTANRALSRDEDGASVTESEYGLYGVNSNGNYIYLLETSNSTNATDTTLPSAATSDYNLKYGDYVITVNKDSKNTADSDSSTNAATDDNSTNSYVVTEDNSSTNSPSTTNYNYSAKQFQADEGPADLLKRMPASLLTLVSSELTAETAANLDADTACGHLNTILSKGSAATDILLNPDNGIVTKALTTEESSVLNELLSANATQAVRRIIDSLFTQSPKADLLSPSIDAMYPYLAMDLGEQVSNTVNEEEVTELSASRMAESYSAYEEEQKAIKNKFSEYFAYELKKIKLPGGTSVELSKYGVSASLGIKGSLSVSGSRVQAGVSGVIYIDMRLALIKNGFPKLKAKLEDLLKADLKTTVMVGPVPVTVGSTINFKLNMTIDDKDYTDSEFDVVFTYCGLYGAGINAGANWGIDWRGKWFFRVPVPYVNFFADTYTVKESSWYFGTTTEEGPDDLHNFVLIPEVIVVPSLGVGPKWANFNVSVPVDATLPLQFWWNIDKYKIPYIHEVDLGLTVDLKANLAIKILVFNMNKELFSAKLFDRPYFEYKADGSIVKDETTKILKTSGKHFTLWTRD